MRLGIAWAKQCLYGPPLPLKARLLLKTRWAKIKLLPRLRPVWGLQFSRGGQPGFCLLSNGVLQLHSVTIDLRQKARLAAVPFQLVI